MGNFTRFVELLLDTERSWRIDKFNTKIKDYEIDTCYCPDVQKWETGIKTNGEWTIVEEYSNRENAKVGHDKWVKECEKENPVLTSCRTAEDWMNGD